MTRQSQMAITAEFIAESSGGRLASGQGLAAGGGLSVDSRTLRPGQAFLALRGPRFDGHDYMAAAVERGASGLVVDEERLADTIGLVARTSGRLFVVVVTDTRKALAAVASAWVRVLAPRVVAITGSVGKSTTKDLVAAVAGTGFTTHATSGNLNNEIGLPLTCLQLVPAHEVLVAEMGMSAPGEIARLCTMAPPSVALVTCVAAVHLERLLTLDAVANAKAEVVEALQPSGRAILNADDPRVMAMAGRTSAARLTFGRSLDADVRIAGVTLDDAGRAVVVLDASGRRVTARLALVGEHQAQNAAAAVAAGLALGIEPEAAADGMEKVGPGKHRMTCLELGEVRVIDDCYNASPRSVSAALAVLAAIPARGRKVAVLGDMLELGPVSDEAHLSAGREAAAAGVGLLVAVGGSASLVAQGATEGGLPARDALVAADATEAVRIAREAVRPGDLALIKGSRGIGLETVVDFLASRFGRRESC